MNPGREGAPGLIVRDLSAARGGETILAGIGFSLGPGESLVVTGPNGCGKSTLLRVLAGLLPAAGGLARMAGIEAGPDAIGVHSHYLGHLNAMRVALTLRENLGFWRDFHGNPALGVEEALDQVRLAGLADLPYGYLSTGQRRRASLARLLLNHRPVWLLDEPTAGLDSLSKERLAGLMHAHVARGGIIIAATHEPLGLDAAARLDLTRTDR